MTASNGILIVGYDSDTSHILELWLSHLGYVVWIIDDANRALDVALAVRPGLVITNYPTRLASGRTVVETVRATPELAGTPLLNLTSHAFSHELEGAAAAGANRSLRMPASLDTIARAIARLTSPHVGEQS